jgi:uroporphyrin-III C-methyltransferase
LAAQSSATVVILMGMSKIKCIQEEFKKVNKGNTAIAIIQNGTTPQEKIGIGTINNVLEVVKNNELSSPAIIVIGDVVKNHAQFKEIYNQLEHNCLKS